MSVVARPTARPDSSRTDTRVADADVADAGAPLADRLVGPGPVVRLLARANAWARADAWALPALLGVAALAAVLYLVDLTVSGYANTYYAMAAQAASQSWSAWFFGSLDASNFITLDKPPLSTMAMGLSVRLLGLSSTSILLPQALMGVATVVVLFLAVRKSFGTTAATIAAVVMALTPVAVLMFRFDNPDALLTLLLVSGTWALLRALDAGRIRWLVLAGTFIGLAFMTKYLQGWLVLPAFALVWAVAAPGGWRRRVAGLVVSAATVAVVSLAWPVAVELIPTASRPYIGGSTGDSVFDLIFGYDGLGRIFGGSGGPVGAGGVGAGGGGGGAQFGGTAGLLRMFNSEFGGQVAWLLPYSLVALLSGLAIRWRRARTDGPRAGYLLWGGWLLVNVLVFSFMSGTIHPYYTVVLAPAIGALVGAGTIELWRLRERSAVAGVALAGAIVASGLLAWMLLERSASFVPGLGIAALSVALAAAILVALPLRSLGHLPAAAMGLGVVALLAGPAAYSVQTIATAQSGGNPTAGPSVASSGGPGGPGGAVGPTSGDGGPGIPGGNVAGLPGAGGPGATADASLTTYLVENAGSASWIVAVQGSGTAAQIQLATRLPVMTMGGFTGSDATPTLAELQAYVASDELRFVLASSGGGGGTGGSTSSELSSWLATSCTVVDGVSSSGMLYDCAGAVIAIG